MQKVIACDNEYGVSPTSLRGFIRERRRSPHRTSVSQYLHSEVCLCYLQRKLLLFYELATVHQESIPWGRLKVFELAEMLYCWKMYIEVCLREEASFGDRRVLDVSCIYIPPTWGRLHLL